MASTSTLLERLDARAGDVLERAVENHHRRRLRRLGWLSAVDGDDSDPPPATPLRAGNAFEVLVDGAAALPRIAERIRSATRSVHLAGWFFTPSFDLTRGASPAPLAELLGEVAEHVEVRVLAWAGAPVPLFRPDRGRVREVAAAFARYPRLRFAVDAKERPLHCHHEKLVIIDDEIAFVGGIDLTTLGGDRFDDTQHRVRDGISWHDVASVLEGPAVADVARHFTMRWLAVTGERLDPPPERAPVGPTALRVVRTVPEKLYEAVPSGEFSILSAYTAALRSAERLVYLENQFLWSPELVAILADKLRRPPTPEFRIVVLLPARPNDGSDDTRGQLGVLAAADGGAERLLACSLYSLGSQPPRPVYVHAKVGIVDDHWLTVGSANLNEHSLFNDSEVNIVTEEPRLARETRLRLWAEHLQLAPDDVSGDPVQVVDGLWRPLAEEGLRQVRAGGSMSQRLVRLDAVSRRTDRLLGPLQSLVVDG